MTLLLHHSHAEGTVSASSSLPLNLSRPDVSRNDDALARLICQPMRSAILRALLAREAMSFTELKRALSITDGNLSTHARKLMEAGVINCSKGFRRQFPRTEYSLTPAGKQAVERLLGTQTDNFA